MKNIDIKNKLDGQIICGDENAEATSLYAGDLLSHVMGKANKDCCWFTIMNNINVCAVASLCEVACVVLCEGIKPDDSLLARAITQGVTLISTELEIASAIEQLLK